MKPKLVFASHNANKVIEIGEQLKEHYTLVSLDDIGCTEDIPETGNTLEANARIKAFYVWNKFRLPCFADDTGLEVQVLNNEPGVHSARYAGEQRDSNDNIDLLLQRLADSSNRKAQFRTSICLVENGEERYFEGVVKGEILYQREGSGGFGYDPVFRPEGETRSFAQMSMSEKNAISHRGKAVAALIAYLSQS